MPGYHGRTGALHRLLKDPALLRKRHEADDSSPAGVSPSKKSDDIRWFSEAGECLSDSGTLPDRRPISADSDSGDGPDPPYHSAV